LVIPQSQAFLTVLAIFGVIGAVRGWHREVITAAIVLATVLFLTNGGGNLISNIFIHGAGAATQPSSASSYSSACYGGLPSTVSNFSFAGLTIFGYRVGGIYAPAPALAHHRVSGASPGLVNGGAIAYYISRNILPGTNLVIGTPSPGEASSYLPLVFGLGILVLLVVVFITTQSSKSKSK
jgi:hypothetical protein